MKSLIQIPMSAPDVTSEDIDAVVAVLRTPTLSIGPKVDALEDAGAAYVGSRYAVAVNSGTAGLHLSVIAAGIAGG